MFLPRKLLALLIFSPLAFSADYQIEANIRYAAYPETILDVIQSPAPALKNRPGVIVIHGAGEKADMVEKFCVPLAKQDFVVANVEYRASDAESDVNAAAQWFSKHADRFKVDPNQILVLGQDAGGTLAQKLVGIKIIAAIDFQNDGVHLANKAKPGDTELIKQTEPSQLWPQIFKWLKKRKIGA